MSAERGLDWGRFGRILALIAFVTAVFVFLAADRLGSQLFPIAIAAIGSIALVTAMTGFLIALGSAVDEGRHTPR